MNAAHDASAPSDDQRWEDLLARRSGQGGEASVGWLYAVRTTGIYCRPGCPSRLPLRANVTFFGDAAMARAAGFRPCKRCGDVETG